MRSFVKVPNKRLLLTEEDFTTLVSGNILVKDGFLIALQDIGFQRMKQIIDNQDGNYRVTQEELRAMIDIFSDERPTRRSNRNNIDDIYGSSENLPF
jgi:hypothetical protein